MTTSADENYVLLCLYSGDEAGPVHYEASRYADLIASIGQAALERVEFFYAIFHDGRSMIDGPHRFIGGQLGYDCRKDPEFGYRHASHDKMFGWVKSAAALPHGQMQVIRLEVSNL